jgi:hypothetical protein
MKGKTVKRIVAGAFALVAVGFVLFIYSLEIPEELGPIRAYDGGSTTIREYEEEGVTYREEVDSNGTRHGKYEAWESGSKYVDGQYANGLEQGLWIYTGPEAQHIEVTYDEGRFNGPFREWYPNGHLAAVGEDREGNRVGPWSCWKEDGSPIREETGFYEDGTKVRDLEEPERVDPASVPGGTKT